MAEIDLRTLPGDEFVLHFGGRPNEVDAYTFSNSIVALSEALQEINRQVYPEFGVQIFIEGVGPGSFRAKLKTATKSLGGLFKRHSPSLLVNILAAIIYTRYIAGYVEVPTETKIIITEDSVIFEGGHDKIIVSKNVWDQKERLRDKAAVERQVARAFAAMENDPSITNFGLSAHLDDAEPVGVVPRERFAVLAAPADEKPADGRRYRDEQTTLTVLKAIFQQTPRKWEFVWQGVRISAPIRDQEFFEKLAAREIWFAQGDTLEVLLRVHQTLDDLNNVYINQSYEILKVYGVRHSGRQPRLSE